MKLIVVLVQNHGFASIGALSESLGSQRFGTRYRYRTGTGLDGDVLPVDLAANAASLGADVIRATTIDELEKALRTTRRPADGPRWSTSRPTRWSRLPTAPPGGTFPWPRSSALDSTQAARTAYDEHKARTAPPPASVGTTLGTDRKRRRRAAAMRTIEHWIGGKLDRRNGRSTLAGVEPRDR